MSATITLSPHNPLAIAWLNMDVLSLDQESTGL